MKDLIDKLRTDASARVIWTPSHGTLAKAAADAIEKLEAENAALKAELAVEQECNDTRKRRCEFLERGIAHLKAELAAMREQEPVWYLYGMTMWEAKNHRITEHIKKHGKPFYAAPGAK